MKCGKVATIHYKWGTDDHYSCEEHAEQVAKLCKFMSWPFCPHVYLTGDKVCQQEMEEKKEK